MPGDSLAESGDDPLFEILRGFFRGPRPSVFGLQARFDESQQTLRHHLRGQAERVGLERVGRVNALGIDEGAAPDGRQAAFQAQVVQHVFPDGGALQVEKMARVVKGVPALADGARQAPGAVLLFQQQVGPSLFFQLPGRGHAGQARPQNHHGFSGHLNPFL